MAVFGSMRLLINRLITKDKELGTKHPLIYPLVKMALLFLLLQFSVHIMFYLTQAEWVWSLIKALELAQMTYMLYNIYYI